MKHVDKITIAIISHEYPPHANLGGVARFNYNLAHLLSSEGHLVYVFTSEKNQSGTYNDENIKVVLVPFDFKNKALRFLYHNIPGKILRSLLNATIPRLFFILEWNLFAFLAFRAIHRHVNFQVVHAPSYNIPALFLGIWNRFTHRPISIILHIHGTQMHLNRFEPLSQENKWRARLENWHMTSHATATIACSNTLKKSLRQELPKLLPTLLMCHNFVSHTTLDEKPSSFDPNKLVYVGRLEHRKGVDILLNAFIQLAPYNPHLTLYLIGNDGSPFPYKYGYRDFNHLLASYEKINMIRNRIVRIPRIDNPDVLSYVLNRLRGIAIFPSRYEPFGFVTLETMTLGYIVIASKQGGGKEIISHGLNGFLCDPTDQSVLKTVRHALSLSYSEQLYIGKQARQTIKQRFVNQKAKHFYQTLYQSLRLIS